MASGLLGFLGFGKKSKPNLTQNYMAPPSASSAPLFEKLRNLADKRLSGQDLGFGSEYVDKNVNPVAESMRRNFRNVTSPFLSNQYSSRGMGRSTLAANSQGLAEGNVESDIGNLMAQFYQLNEAQKKTDLTEGIRVGDQLNTQYLNQGNEAASQFNAAERGNTERTAGVAATNNAADRARQNQVIGTLMNAVAPGSGTAFMPQATPQATTSSQNNTPIGPGSNILGSLSSPQLNAMSIQDLLKLFGG